MLYANSTPKGTGIEIWGDYNDLESLHATMVKLANNGIDPNSYERNAHLLSIVPFEVRHAFQGDRYKTDVDNGNTKTTYYGFRVNWITLLYTISALRYNAGLMATDDIDQSNLLLLEHWTRESLYAYDALGARFVELFINRRIDVTHKHVYQIHQHLLNIYFSEKPTKRRFRNIPSLLISVCGQDMEEFLQYNDITYENELDTDRGIVW